MIAPAQKYVRSDSGPAWHAGFLSMLPQILRYAQAAFRHLDVERREDLIEEAVANALVAYVRLVELGKAELAYPTVLAKYAIAQIREGRRVGNRLNIRDVASSYAQRKKHFTVERLDRFDGKDGSSWREAVVEDHQTPVADQVAFRVDFPQWLATFNRRDRRIAELLATGHSTGHVAQRFGLSAGRISQKRREYRLSWLQFHEEASRQKAVPEAAC